MFLLSVEGIHHSSLFDYPKTWFQAVQSIERIAANNDELTDSGGAENAVQTNSVLSVKQCHNNKCCYCAFDVKAALQAVVLKEKQKSPEGYCLPCTKERLSARIQGGACIRHGVQSKFAMTENFCGDN